VSSEPIRVVPAGPARDAYLPVLNVADGSVAQVHGRRDCLRTAATRWIRKRAGSLSASSGDRQATCRLQPATHTLTSVVLPKPARAEDERRFAVAARVRARRTIFGGGGG
jgi:hypothetical protein